MWTDICDCQVTALSRVVTQAQGPFIASLPMAEGEDGDKIRGPA